jgi:peptidoglycan/LPS O-acetylase OafA/YrhL
MLARLLTLLAVLVSLVGSIAEATGTAGWWPYHVERAGYVLVVLAVVAALLSERKASAVTLVAQLLAAAAAVAFAIVALVKFYETTTAFNQALRPAYPWHTEALTLAVAALAFGLTLERRRSTGIVACLLAATGVTVGCALYALTQKANLAAEIWWLLAPIGAFLAAAAAAQHEREGAIALGAPEVAGGEGTVALSTPEMAGSEGGVPPGNPGIE